MKYIIALGSNKGNRLTHLSRAKKELQRFGELIHYSSIYENPALGDKPQMDFYNAVCEISTDLSPLPLLDALKKTEKALGRLPSYHWGPREIDLDIIDYDGNAVKTDKLLIPHPEMDKRDFVLIPLMEIMPDYKNRSGISIRQLIDNLDRNSTVFITKEW